MFKNKVKVIYQVINPINISLKLKFSLILDKLAVIFNGKIAELGSYDALMSLENGLFKKLNKNQVLTS